MDHETHDIEELEYDDGLGDIIRSKATSDFSWKKTATILILLLLTIGLFLGLFLKAGKSLLTSTNKDVLNSDNIQYLSDTELKTKINEIEKENSAITKPRAVVKKESLVELEPVKPASQPTTPKQSTAPAAQSSTTAAKSTPSTVASTSGYTHKVVVGSYENKAIAVARKNELKKLKIDSYIWTVTVNGKTVHRLQVSASKNLKQSQDYAAKLKKSGIDAYVVSIKSN